jgi:hypothetical protein
MAKTKKPEIPSVGLYQIIEDLNLYNGLFYQLKNGTKNLIEAVESGNLDHAKQVVKIFKMKEVLDQLVPQSEIE